MKKIYILILVMTALAGKTQNADSVKVLDHLNRIVNTEYPRDYTNFEVLDEVATYIHDVFDDYADSTRYQTFKAADENYRNVIGSFGTSNKNRLIIGAHYDVCGNQPGADDNASGVVGLLELARLLEGKELNTRVDLVAYTLEEPPFFRSEFMGSHIHAKWLYDNNIPVDGMICLEMIGYFDDAKKSQDYPIGLLKLFYGGRGDYITVVSKMNRGKFARQFKRKMKRNKEIKTKSFQAPAGLPGIDFSDHLNYWKYGYSAVMITNTAFYRNKNYHQSTDNIASLDITRMTAVIQSVYETVLEMTRVEK